MITDLGHLLHSQLRLAIVSLLMSEEEAEFNYIKEKTKSAAGNLRFQISKPKELDYIEVGKSIRDNFPLITCKITETGREAFTRYVSTLQSNIRKNG